MNKALTTIAAVLAMISTLIVTASTAHASDTKETSSRSGIVPVSSEFRSAMSPAAMNMRGVQESLYQGKWYNPKRGERFRLCVIDRESRGYYRAANKRSSARGAYQFLDSQWRDSLVWMLRPEARKNGLVKQVDKLRNKPIHEWSRYWQDAAFWTVYRNGKGAKHWGTFGRYRNCGT